MAGSKTRGNVLELAGVGFSNEVGQLSTTAWRRISSPHHFVGGGAGPSCGARGEPSGGARVREGKVARGCQGARDVSGKRMGRGVSARVDREPFFL